MLSSETPSAKPQSFVIETPEEADCEGDGDDDVISASPIIWGQVVEAERLVSRGASLPSYQIAENKHHYSPREAIPITQNSTPLHPTQ